MEEETNTLTNALENFASENYKTAIEIFTELAKKNEDKPIYSLYSAVCENKLKNYSKALDIIEPLEKKLPNSSLLFFEKGYALFQLDKFVESKLAFSNSLQNANNNEDRKKINRWISKSVLEIKDLGIIEYNDQLAKDLKVINNWMQTGTDVIVELTANQSLSKFDVKIENKKISLITKDGKNETKYFLNLSNEIDPEKSTFKISGMKSELTLKKKVPNFNWVVLENKVGNAGKVEDKAVPGYYPTSSKIKKDWTQLDNELDKEFKEDDKKDADNGMWTLFRQIYERSDENTRRAMVKSFQTSGGTVLSTNWGEVKDKDYEGKDRPEPPKGQEWAKKD